MTIYFAGGCHYDFLEGDPMLESFWYKRNAEKAMTKTDNFFLDSGAFSAFTKGAQIDINEYAAYVTANREKITVASSLDAIGDAEASYRNYRILKDKGIDVIPVFHCREEVRWLQKYLDEGVPYLALGGMVPESKDWLRGWLDGLWGSHLTFPDGRPRTKVHGFGLTVGWLIERYPWFSVDSTTWLNGARFGTCIFNFPGRRLVHVAMSDRNPMARQANANHIDRLPFLERSLADEQLRQAGVTKAMLEDTNELLRFNAWSFKQWEKDYGFPKTFIGAQQEGLFG